MVILATFIAASVELSEAESKAEIRPGTPHMAGLSIGRKVLRVMFWEVPTAGGPLL